jgi:hypothetical protein
MVLITASRLPGTQSRLLKRTFGKKIFRVDCNAAGSGKLVLLMIDLDLDPNRTSSALLSARLIRQTAHGNP